MNAISDCKVENHVDEAGNPNGGVVLGDGLRINWQQGPLGRGDDRVKPNGAFVETVISAAKQRIEFYQEAFDGKFACEENQYAIDALNVALGVLEERTKKREARQVEGTHTA